MFGLARYRTTLAAALLAGGALLAGCGDTRNRVTMKEVEDVQAQRRHDPGRLTRDELRKFPELQPYRAQPGDVLALTMIGPSGRVFGERQSTSQLPPGSYGEAQLRFRIGRDGTILVPPAGTLAVAGLTLSEIERVVYEAHVPAFYKDFSVYAELSDTERTSIVVVGAQGTPQVVALRNNERTVLNALARSGVYATQPVTSVRVIPVGDGRAEMSYNLNDPVEARLALLSAQLESGDMLVIEAAPTSAVYVMGLVNLPGPVPVPPGTELTIMRAIAHSGGLVDLLEPQVATVWRKLPSGEQVRIKVEMRDVAAGRAPDLALYGGDILEIPHTADTRVRQWALANLGVGPFKVGVNYDPLNQYNINRALDTGSDGGFRGAVRESLRFGIPELIVPSVRQTTP